MAEKKVKTFEEKLELVDLKLKLTKVKVNPKVLVEKLGKEVLAFPSGKVLKFGDVIVELDHNIRSNSVVGLEIDFIDKEVEKAEPKKVKPKKEVKKEGE